MSWRCRLVDSPKNAQVGDMWFAPHMLEQEWTYGFKLSAEYRRDWEGKRAPLMVILPNGSQFCVDGATTDDGDGGWTVTGEPPLITVSPSINVVGLYHGFLQNGVLSDDVEGRKL